MKFMSDAKMSHAKKDHFAFAELADLPLQTKAQSVTVSSYWIAFLLQDDSYDL